MIIIVIWSVKGISDQNPLPQASTMRSGSARTLPSTRKAATAITSVPPSAKMKASGIHCSVNAVLLDAKRSRNANALLSSLTRNCDVVLDTNPPSG